MPSPLRSLRITHGISRRATATTTTTMASCSKGLSVHGLARQRLYSTDLEAAAATTTTSTNTGEGRTRPVVDASFRSKYARTPDAGARLAAHLNQTFAPLEFPPELAARVLTHLSHRESVHGHNARLAFLGRRVLESYMMFWLHSLPPNVSDKVDFAYTTERALDTLVLGRHVAPRWGVSSVMRWSSPAVRVEEDTLPDGDGGRIGLHKVAGTAVEAVVGGIYHQFGGSVSHRVFHTRLLPHLLLRGKPAGLPEPLLDHARASVEKMWGAAAPLAPSPVSTH